MHIAPGGALQDAVAIGNGNDEDAGGGNGKSSVVSGDSGSCRSDASENGGFWKVERALGEVDLEGGGADLNGIGFGNGKVGARLRVEGRTPPKQSLDGAPQEQEGEGSRLESRGHVLFGRMTGTKGPREQGIGSSQ